MSVYAKKISDFSSNRFRIIGYCSHCTCSHEINQDKYPDVRFDDIREKQLCPACKNRGLNLSIVLRKKPWEADTLVLSE